jgi:type VI secretion system protein ImpL
MKKLLLNRWFLGTIGVLLLALVLWFLGPYFAFGESRPLLSVLGRVIAVLVLVLVWIGILQWQYFRAVRGSQKLAADVAGQAEAPAVAAAGNPAQAAATAGTDQVKTGFEDAVAQLRKDKRGGGNLYHLPWYVIIGPPGSGKTTALVNSGLRFPMEQTLGKTAIRGVGGTRNCDWWFTDEAILLDTAGRYTTQDSDRIADGAGWGGFLQLLKKHRRRQPINGVLLAYSAADLLTRTDQEFAGDVAAIRARLDELNRHLGIELPIYLLVTKSDLIAGFREYFENLDADGRAQVWGTTFALAESRGGTAAAQLPARFDELAQRLHAGMFSRLAEERDTRRRARLFGFPQQFAALRPRLLQLVDQTFGSTGFDRRLVLRGVYFTSGTQEGTPIDRLLGSLSRSLGVSQDARQLYGDKGRSYFIERLLREVVLQESGLAGANRRAQWQTALVQGGAYIGVAALTLALVAWMFFSYRGNAAYLDEVAAAAQPLAKAAPVTPDVSSWLPRLGAVRAVVTAAERNGEGPPFSMRAGLYQGHAAANAAHEAYARETNATLVPQLAQSFERRLDELIADPDKLYEYLKAYLMLGDPQRVDAGQLAFLARYEWERAYPDRPDVRDALNTHFGALLDGKRLMPVPLDADLVARARNALAAATPAALAYSRLKLLYASDRYRPLRFDREVAQINAVLARRSGNSWSEPLPALFTRDVYNEISGQGTEQIAKALQEDAWVFGEGATAQIASGSLVYDVLGLYDQEYIETWDNLLADVALLPVPKDPREASTFYGRLGSPSSPLKVLLGIVAKNTTFAKPEGGGAADAATDAIEKAAAAKAQQSALGKVLLGGTAAAPTREPGAAITAHFAELHQLVAAPPGSPAPIDRVLEVVRRLGGEIGRVADASGGTGGLDSMKSGGGGGAARDLEIEVGTLPPAIAGILTAAAGGGQDVMRNTAKTELADLYSSQIVNQCREIIDGRYPFTRGANVDVPVADFARLFGTGGVFDQFFTQYLAALVDTNRSPWQWREAGGGDIGLPDSIPAQFEMVAQIRQQFFRPGAAEPELRVTLAPEFLDSNVQRLVLEMNGERLEYAHGPLPRWSLKWPMPAADQVIVTFDFGTGPGSNQVYDGPWALFRFIDAAAMAPLTDVRFQLNLTGGGANARLLLDAGSVRNPFAKPLLSRFRCG